MEAILDRYNSTSIEEVKVWFKAASINDFPADGGACVKYKNKQIAVFNFARTGKWYACQNVCPHKMEMVLSRGMIGDDKGTPKVACPLHKKTFSLENGENLNGDIDPIATYPVKIEGDNVFIGFAE
ncbi:nitrite reductase small subunit NirD [Aquimarina agarilytica]|uniref:nitrite reductase small subunit NirD n=1 Tax=Aquimarina agarilytica TaxID=1087449 RepID=UPI000289D40A|nr:nitrite reductase small subunit NirD [Aquimarina agarilytica]